MIDGKRNCPNLEDAAGFDLRIFGKDGGVLYDTALFSANSMVLTRLETVVVSAARTLAYMHLFSRMEGDTEKDYFQAHLRDFERKAKDFRQFEAEGR